MSDKEQSNITEQWHGLIEWNNNYYCTIEQALRMMNEEYQQDMQCSEFIKIALHGHGWLFAFYVHDLSIQWDGVGGSELFSGFFVPWYSGNGQAYLDMLAHGRIGGGEILINDIDITGETRLAVVEGKGIQPEAMRLYVDWFELSEFIRKRNIGAAIPVRGKPETQKKWIHEVLTAWGIDLSGKLPEGDQTRLWKLAESNNYIKRGTVRKRLKEMGIESEHNTRKT